MFEPETILQRTQAGRDEIYQKTCGLTQSERLVLIMIDGVASCQRIRSKVPVLSDERFNRALLTLQEKDLVGEVFLPLEGQAPEQFELTVIERFLQQEPLDPITIISFDPEEQFGIAPSFIGTVERQGPSFISQAPMPESAAQVAQPNAHAFADALPVAVDPGSYSPLDEAMAGLLERAPVQFEGDDHHLRERRNAAKHRSSIKSRLHWGYWLMGFGIALIIGFFLGRASN